MNTASASTAIQQAQDAFTRRRVLDLLFDSAGWGLVTLAQLAVTAAMAGVLSSAVGWAVTAPWAVVLSTTVMGKATYATMFRRRPLSDKQVAYHIRLFIYSAFMVGAMWAFAGWYLYPPFNEELRLFLVFVLGGISLSAVGTQHIYLPVCYASMGLAVPVLALRFFIDGHVIEPLLLTLYTLILFRLASMLSKFSLQTTRLQYERDLLLQQLTTRAQEMEDAKQEAEEANLAKSRFLAQASHDLRQPLHAIGLFVETISNDNLTPRVNNIVERVQTSLGALSKLFDSLLDITQLDTRKINRNDMNFALQEMFDQLQQDFRPIAREQQVELRFARTSVAIRSDVILFGRLLQNLISNAIRYAPGGRVLVGVRRGARYSIEVLDTGPGIAPEDQARIFQEFVRLEPKDQLLAPGLGLGLAIVQRVAGILTLRLDLDSTPSRGTRFAVRGLEPATGALSPIVEETRSTPAHTLEGARICVIDDDVEVLEATERLLSQWGCQVQTTDKLEDVADTVDVVISDVELADGVNAFDVFGAQEPDFELVFISGNTSAELRERANAHHAPLLHKPVRPVQLRSALLHVLTRDANAGARDV